jgi:hypothetical protein
MEPYYLSSDTFDLSQIFVNKSKPHIFVGIANTHFPHAMIRGLFYEQVIISDINPKQCKHAKFMIKCIKESETRIEFVKKFFKIKTDIIDPTKKNIWDNSTWADIPIGEMTSQGIIYNAKNSYGGPEIETQRLHLFKTSGRIDFWLGWNWGWLQNEKTFKEIQNNLNKVEIYCEDIKKTFEKVTKKYPIILWLSNTTAEIFIKKTKMDEFINNLHKMPEIDVRIIQDNSSANVVTIPDIFLKGKDYYKVKML